jgi:hypothetical protein
VLSLFAVEGVPSNDCLGGFDLIFNPLGLNDIKLAEATGFAGRFLRDMKDENE